MTFVHQGVKNKEVAAEVLFQKCHSNMALKMHNMPLMKTHAELWF